MQNDKTTLHDLSIFTNDGSKDVFSLADHTITQVGRDVLKKYFLHPPADLNKLLEVQAVVKFWSQNLDKFPSAISNGTMAMLINYFDSSDNLSLPPHGFTLRISGFFQKILQKNAYSLIKFSFSHLRDFLRGCSQLAGITQQQDVPGLLLKELVAVKDELQNPVAIEIMKTGEHTAFNDLRKLNYKARRELKDTIYRLIHIYARIDAWHAMAKATVVSGWVFPELMESSVLQLDVEGLYHPLLQRPVAYHVKFDNEHNFMVLTGANMSGKTTFLRSVGVAGLLAHIGMGVPATAMRISFLQSIITHMQVEDNIIKGESYFYAEVQRMKNTAEKIVAPAPCMVLMDEIFKGTNVHDAYECTKAVVEGLLNHPRHIMILSTHLYEVAHHFSDNKKVIFEHFVTQFSKNGGYEFTYTMQPGISNDRIGYRILEKEGIINLLTKH